VNKNSKIIEKNIRINRKSSAVIQQFLARCHTCIAELLSAWQPLLYQLGCFSKIARNLHFVKEMQFIRTLDEVYGQKKL